MTNLLINGVTFKSLVDTGCQQSVVSSNVVHLLGEKHTSVPKIVTMLDGNTTMCLGEVSLKITAGTRCVNVRCLVSKSLVCGCAAIIGMDAVKGLGGLTVSSQGVPSFGGARQYDKLAVVAVGVSNKPCSLQVEDADFVASFNDNKWTVTWKWKGGEPVLKNQCGQYEIPEKCRESYEQEIGTWIENGWLEEHNEADHGKVQGVIPMMAAFQPNKEKKVRPVMDYSRELNQYISCNPGADVAVCQDKLRKWRRLGPSCCMLDLKKAYLQLFVDAELLKFQAVRYKGKLFVMTRMGFGLNVAPKIMSKVLGRVLSMDSAIQKGTDHYIDDIIVDEEVVSVVRVKEHLANYGLITKDPESIDNARVLGLRVKRGPSGQLRWKRDNDINVGKVVTKRDLFSLCGKLVGHYPVGGWLRVACSFMKRSTNDFDWDEPITKSTLGMLGETMQRLQEKDPVSGQWHVSGSNFGTVWCDASNLAVGMSVEIDGEQVEDGSWLRKDDGNHINVAELDAVIRGINSAVKWSLTSVTVVTDSATVYAWVQSIISNSKRPKVNGLGEMLIRRRLAMVAELIELYDLEVRVRLVKSEENLADALTRVPRSWLQTQVCAVGCASNYSIPAIRDLHDTNHLGSEKTLHLAKCKWGDAVVKEDIAKVVRECHVCRQVDPAPVKWESGKLSVETTWTRLASDITHCNGVPFLTVIDCGPSRYWSNCSMKGALRKNC